MLIRLPVALLAVAITFGGTLLPSLARACGGLFCASAATVPVEQNGERILFEVNDKGVVSTTVEIAYTGEPGAFAWVVPVGAFIPTLETVPEDVLARLATGTAPVMAGQPSRCRQSGLSGCSAGGVARTAGEEAAAALAQAMAAPWAPLVGCAMTGDDDDWDDWEDDVQVEELERVGPYEPTVVSSDDPAALILWLNTNGYVVTDAMTPFIAGYVLSGSRFLAMKLAPGAGVSDIAPIRISYPAQGRPSIPLVLTAVAAEPEMEIVAFVAASQRYGAENYANLLMDPTWLRYDASGATAVGNYPAVASWLADRVGGAAFFTQYVGPVAWAGGQGDETDQWLGALRDRHPKLTRMSGTLSAWEMTMDPVFAPSQGGDVPAALDLSANEPVDVCGGGGGLGVCGATYCGPDAACVPSELGPACACPEGWTARMVTGRQPGGAPQVTCQRGDHDVFTGPDAPDLGGVCGNIDCGLGECVGVGGFPTCACDEGAVAGVRWGDAAPTCVEARGDPVLPADGLVGGDLNMAFAARTSTGAVRAGAALAFWLALAGVATQRRRRGAA